MNSTKLHFSLILLSLCHWAFGQQYQAFDPNAEIYYGLDQGSYTSLHALTARGLNPQDPDTYYGYYVAEPAYSLQQFWCIEMQATSWMGDSVRVEGDSLTIFYNAQGLPIYVKNLAELNENWQFFLDDDGSYLEATVIAWQSEMVMGQLDSVKTIQFEAFLTNGSPDPNHPFHLSEWKLSQSFGFLEMPAMGWFPEVTDPYVRTDYEQFTLSEVFDFQIGDEFEVCQEPATFFYRVLQKYWSANNDTVFYEMMRTVQVPTELPPYFNKDTIVQAYTHLDQRVRDKMPNETSPVAAFDSIGWFRPYRFLVRNSDGRRIIQTQLEINLAIDSCYSDYVFSFAETAMYIEDLGKLTTYHAEMGANTPESLCYYKIGNEVFGEPTDIDPEMLPPAQFQLGPNPSRDWIQVSWEAQADQVVQFRLLDIQGLELQVPSQHRSAGQTQELQMNLQSLSPGIYLFQITGPNGWYTERILVQ